MHVILFVCHYFHTHSLSTGWCLWRSDLRSDLSSFSLYLSCPVFDVISWSSSSLTLTSAHLGRLILTIIEVKKICSFKCDPEWEPTAHVSSPQGSAEGWQQLISVSSPLFSFYTFPAKCTVFLCSAAVFCGLCIPLCPHVSGNKRHTSN